ncbi:uncharacterized protein ARMOST_11434 [Armillaria ostoyae]|uniref:Uncharacterized protein n=1 Tax=Armillaria ostoyae TaxID=47428 RepID=A0A284RH39_ARMOS|nr:uncharacterized protein ARMOST_11434 [Armillaria ostoyae]
MSLRRAVDLSARYSRVNKLVYSKPRLFPPWKCFFKKIYYYSSWFCTLLELRFVIRKSLSKRLRTANFKDRCHPSAICHAVMTRGSVSVLY